MSHCPSVTQLQRLLDEQLSDGEQDDLVQHLDHCAACLQTLERLSDEYAGHGQSTLPRKLHQPPAGFLAHLEQRLSSAARQTAHDWPQVHGYEILGILGRGGMGVVYRARQTALKRLVALKMILAGVHAASDHLARFRAEAEAVAQLQHPHIVQIHEVGEHEGLPYFALELVDGGSLEEQLDGTPWPTEQAAQLMATVADAVHYAHQQGVIHRDLKPANILLAAHGLADVAPTIARPQAAECTPKITDFGLAKQVHVEGKLTRSGAILGTPQYMAPEQAQGQATVGPAADVYALGAILYELLTGRPPFTADTPLDVLVQVVQDEPVPPGRLRPRLPRDVETICLKCLAKEPRHRYATVRDLAEDLRRWLKGEPIQARPVGVLGRGWRWARRRPAVASLLALVVVLTLTGFGVVTWQLQQVRTARDEEAKANERLERNLYFKLIALADQELERNNAGRAEELLAQCPEHLRGWEWNFLKRRRHAASIVLRGHSDVISNSRYCADGRTIATASHDHTVMIWDARTGNKLHTLRGHTDWVDQAVYSPDGRYLVTKSRLDRVVKMWEVQTGRELYTLQDQRGMLSSLAFSYDGRQFASPHNDNTVKIRDVATGKEILTLRGHTAPIPTLTYSPNGQQLASGSRDKTIRIWDAHSGNELHVLHGHTEWIPHIHYSPDGLRLSSTSWDDTVKVWDPVTGQGLFTLHGQAGGHGTAFSPDNRLLGKTTMDGTVGIFDATTGQEIFHLLGHTGPAYAVAFSRDNERIFTAGWDRTVKVWDRLTGQEVLTLRGHSGIVWRLALSPDGLQLASSSQDATVRLWNAAPLPEKSGRRLLTFREHKGIVRKVVFLRGGQHIASASMDGTVKVWTATSGTEVLALSGHAGGTRSLALSHDGQRLATAGWDRTMKIWNVRTGQELLRVPLIPRETSVVFSPDDRQITLANVGGRDASEDVKLYDTATGREVARFPGGATGGIFSVAYSPDGQQLATARQNGTLQVWDTATRQLLHTLRGHVGWLQSVAYSPDGRQLVSAGLDGTVRFWDPNTGQALRVLRGHDDYVTSVTYSPDGRRLASTGWGEVKLWDAATGELLETLRGHAGMVWSVAFSPDGQQLAAASGYAGKGEVTVWDLMLIGSGVP